MRLASLAAALLFAAPVWAQTTIYQQSFEDDDPSFTSSITCNDGDDDFFTRTDGSDIATSYEVTGVDGAFFFAAQDMDAAECAGTGNLPQRISFDDIDISGFENLSFAGLFAEDDDGTSNDWDDADFVHIKYRIDSDDDADLQNLLWFENDGSQFNSVPLEDTDFDGTGDGTEVTSAFAEFTKSIAGTGSTLDIVILISLDSGDEDIAIDNIRISGDEAAMPMPEIDVTPTSLAFGTVEVGMSSTLDVTINNTGDAALSISNVEVSGAGFSLASLVPTTVAAGGSETVTVRFEPASAGAASGTLTISSDDADEPSVQVSLSGTGEDPVTPEPEIDVDPLAVEFGTVQTGMTEQMMVTISNTGDAALTLTYGISGDGFSIVGGPATVEAGGSGTATIQFMPTVAGAASGTFTINSNDADEASVQVSLSGTGEEPATGECAYAFEAVSDNGTTLPSAGGQLRFTFQVDNSEGDAAAAVDLWAVVSSGEEDVYVRNPRSFSVPAGASYKAGFNQRVPASIADGAYTYTLMAGTFNAEDPAASETCGMEAFSVTKGDVNAAKASVVVRADDWTGMEILNAEITEAAFLVTDEEVRVGPNPTRGAATFGFALADDAEVSLALYDVRGRTVATVIDGALRAGVHTVDVSESLSPGVYMWRLVAGDRVETGRLTVVR